MAKRQYSRRRMFVILTLLFLYGSLKPFLNTATRTEKWTDFETKRQKLNQMILPRSTETYLTRRMRIRRMMSVEELNDYPGSGANNRHTPRPFCPDC